MPIATTSAPGVSMKLPNATDGIPTEVCSGLLNDTASPSKLCAMPLENGDSASTFVDVQHSAENGSSVFVGEQ